MSGSRFTLRQLDIFTAVARTGQVNRAAEALHLSQAAVSQALNELADAVGVTLFERSGRNIVPTAAARQLMQLVQAPMAQLRDIPEQLNPDSSDTALAGELRLAASSTIARYVLPAILARIRQTHPALGLTVYSGNSASVEQQVADLDAEIGFIEGPAGRDDLEIKAWGTDPLQVIAPPDYPVKSIKLTALDAHPWVARAPGSGTRAVFEQSLALGGFQAPRAQLIIDDSGAIVRAVSAGAGLACVSRLAAEWAGAPARVKFVELPALRLDRPLWRIARAGVTPSPLTRRVLAVLEQAMAD